MSSYLDKTFAALADPSRRLVIRLLRERAHRAGELAAAARIPFPAMSQHLRTLRRSGVVSARRDQLDSRVRIYCLRYGPIEEARAWLEKLGPGSRR